MRWFLLLPGAALCLLAAGVLAGLASEAIGLWYEPAVGAAAAVAFVLTSYLLVPEFKLEAAAFALIVGAIAAWQLTSPPSFYPETYTSGAYEPTYLPIVATYTAGLMSWFACFMWRRRRVTVGERQTRKGPAARMTRWRAATELRRYTSC